MTKLILHIGTHKTGTTSLQSFLHKNRALLKRLGYGVPRTGVYPVIDGSKANRNRNGHFLMYASLFAVEPNTWGQELEDCIMRDFKIFMKAAAKYDVVLLSDERIWYEGAWKPAYWTRMKELLASAGVDEVEIIVYLRRQDEFISSLWRQRIKGRERQSFKNYLKRGSVKTALEYERVLSDLEGAFGQGNVSVRLFDRAAFVGGDIYHDYCDAAGIAWQEDFVIPDEELNSSLTNAAAEIKRCANNVETYREGQNFLRKPAEHATALKASCDSQNIWTEEQYCDFRDRYRAVNELVAERYLGGNGGKLVEWPEFDEEKWNVPVEYELQVAVRMFAEALTEQQREIQELQKTVDELSGRKAVKRATGVARRFKKALGRG